MAIDWSQLIAPGYKSEYEMLYDLYLVQNKSLLWLEDYLGVSHNTIGRRLKVLGISKARSRGKPKEKEEEES